MGDQKATAARRRSRARGLGPGLHPASVEMIVAGERPTFAVRLPDDRRLVIPPAAGVDPSFIEACLREGRTVVLMDTPAGPVIAGALQTAAAPAADARGTLAVEARHLRLRAAETIEIEVPGARLRLDPGGAARLEGDRLVIDMAALVRIFSARVEVP